MNDYLAGATSTVETIFLQDSTSSTGAGKTGLAYNTSGLTCYYKRSADAASVPVTLASIAALGTYVSGGFKEIDPAGMPGCYEFHPPNAAFASGAKEVTFFFTGATGLAQRPIKFRLLAVNPDDGVRYGMTAIPAVAQGNAGALATGDASGRTTPAPGSIDVATLTPPLQALSLRAYLVLTGTTSPVTADTYRVAGLYGGVPYYESSTLGTPIFAWTDGTKWYLTTTSPGTGPTGNYFATASGATVSGTYAAQGSATGTPAVAAHGNAVLAAYQPESSTLLDGVKGWGTWSARQTLQAIFAFLAGKRSGVPAAGSTGTITYQDNAAVSYGTIVVDNSGDITTSGLTPPQ